MRAQVREAARRKAAPRIDWSKILADAVTRPGVISQAYSLFHRYSVGNQLAALMQCLSRKLEPGPINTYVGWQKLGRQVRKGEQALVLVMPVTQKRKQGEVRMPDRFEQQSPGGEEPAASYTRFIERPFWFTLGQTEGEEFVPEPIPEWEEARALSTLQVERIRFTHSDSNCQGYAVGRRVAVSPIAFLPHRTLFHGLAHVVLGHTAELRDPFVDRDDRMPKDLREAEAECVALLCNASLGLPGEEFSRGYIQHWIGRTPIQERNAQRIFRAADAILRAGRDDRPAEESRLFA
jgi:hypothetical protein